MSEQYEVLSPWADVDPIPPRGIAPRLADLNGKRIGLFDNSKGVAAPMLAVVERRLKERFSGLTFSRFHRNVFLEVAQTADKDKYEQWLAEQDAIIYAVGD